MTADDRDDEYSKFMPHQLKYEIIPNGNNNQHYRRQSPSEVSSTESELESTIDHIAKRKGIYHQIISTCAVLLLSAACGMPIGYSAVLLPQLQITNTSTIADEPEREIMLDVEMGSWIASVHSLATPMGSLLSGPLADFLGRRKTLILSVIPMILGWTTLATSQSHFMLIAGRLLCGFATGTLGGPAQVYIAESAEPNLRSLLIGAPFVSYSLGILVVYALGCFMHWRTVAWCGIILPLFAAAAISCIPESPAWLLRKQRTEQALKAFTYLRGNEIIAQKEINILTERINQEKLNTKANENIFKLCCQRIAIKPLFIIITLSILQMFSGTFIVVFYAIDIIAEFDVDFDTKTAAIWTAVVRTLCTLIFCVVLLFIRRRRIIFLSGIGSGLSCLILSIYMYSRLGQPQSSTDIILAATCLLSYIAFNTPLMVMPGIMIGELFPAKIRGRTAGAVFAAMNVALFGLTKAFPLIQANLKMRGVFLIFAIASFLVSVFMFMFQPETKGRTLEQIEDYFKQENWFWFKRDKTYKLKKHKHNASLLNDIKA